MNQQDTLILFTTFPLPFNCTEGYTDLSKDIVYDKLNILIETRQDIINILNLSVITVIF